MRSWTDGGRRRRRPRARDRSRFGGTPGSGSRDSIRYRRNRELIAREVVTALLWVAVFLLLVRLTGVLWRALPQMENLPSFLRPAIPLLTLVGGGLCLLRARANWREMRDIRREQSGIRARLEQQLENEHDEI